jgi:hypothetical protein
MRGRRRSAERSPARQLPVADDAGGVASTAHHDDSCEGILMHPHTFYASLFEPSKRDEVFVIMSFDRAFDARWHEIFEPAIREDLKLKPHRVDFNESGESVLKEILDGVAHARLVLADITCSPMTDAAGKTWPQRNGNVMWELGVAHTMRMPDEVVVIKSDDEATPFDLNQFRAFHYTPRTARSARQFVARLLSDRLQTVDQQKAEHVRRAAMSLDAFAWKVVVDALPHADGIPPPRMTTMGEVLAATARTAAISKLLDLGVLSTVFHKQTAESLASLPEEAGPETLISYRLTAFGRAVALHSLAAIGVPLARSGPR